MLCGLGVDLVEEGRIRKLRELYGERFLGRIFTEEEVAYALKKNPPDSSLAAAFAVKEAFGKALGTGISGFRFKEVSLVRDPVSGRPEVRLYGRAEALFRKKANRIWVSVTHEAGLAVAVVVLEREV
ncbi:holo-ACP synthase [Thermosulfurimonas dismutans]|uniref:holo-ACP synthase n=1 Tax=Thermosulfurimonas dismutans TaxID=999894 RepID=UPI0008385D4B|nr:holo-ACP synthase [Thermosulfurimonas dismutans]